MNKIIRYFFGALIIASLGTCAVFWKNDIPLAQLKQKYAPAPSEFIPVEGLQVHYRDQGKLLDSLPIVLLHGTAASLHTWEAWVKGLESEHRVITLDLPAYGLTGPHPAGNYSVDFYVDFIHQFLQQLGVSKCIVGGNSLGGYIAWNYALKYPQQTAKLILVDAAGYPVKSESIPIAFQLAGLPLIKNIFKYVTPRPVLQKSIENVYGDPERIDEALVDRYFELSLREGNRAAFIERMSSFKKNGLDQHHTKIKSILTPTLIIWGERDLLIPISLARRFEEDLPNDTLVIFPSLGHVPQEEDPALTLKVVQDFLKMKSTKINSGKN
ncbi:MAG: hypothetical protein RI924_357 [Bacteroidota bacterium]|jgi:pimeloyl-ACP methyl ester carboxylesterase